MSNKKIECSTPSQKTIVLAADYKYESQLMTTLKSICLYNRQIKYYLFNKDFPAEWFDSVNEKLKFFDSYIFNVNIKENRTSHYKTYEHINSESTYYRYFSPTLVEDKLLYLDSDLVVTGCLDDFFNIDLGNHFIAAAEDTINNHIYRSGMKFNAGVMLINNALWRSEDIMIKAFNYTELNNQNLVDGDQEVLNYLFQERWIKLPETANYLAGYNYIIHLLKEKNPILINNEYYKEIIPEQTPLIIHYNTAAKPWNNLYTMPFREQYWSYYNLEWSEIIKSRRTS